MQGLERLVHDRVDVVVALLLVEPVGFRDACQSLDVVLGGRQDARQIRQALQPVGSVVVGLDCREGGFPK